MTDRGRTRAEYLVQGFDESMEITAKLLDWRIAAVWFLISGVTALLMSGSLGGLWALPEAIGIAGFAIVRARRATKRYARLRAIMGESKRIPPDPASTSHLPVWRITPLDATDLDELDRRLRIRGQDRAELARATRRAQAGVLAFLTVSALSVLGLLLQILAVFSWRLSTFNTVGAIVLVSAIFAPGILAFRELSVFQDYSATETAQTLVEAQVRLDQLRQSHPAFTSGEVIRLLAGEYVIEADRMIPRPTNRRVLIMLRRVAMGLLLALVVSFAVTWIVIFLTTRVHFATLA